LIYSIPAAAQLPAAEAKRPLLFLFTDLKAVGVGDVVTVLITETATASTGQSADSDREINADVKAGSGLFSFIPSMSLGSKGQRKASATSRKSHNIVASITTTVKEALPNGYFRIEGSQEVIIDQRTQTIKLSGLVRAVDISPDNTVFSHSIADARIEYVGKGDPVMKTKSGRGILGQIIKGFQSILEVIF
jgi:flagellar L-ring protein precursor FlgH